jgi:hypothetical protein
MPDNKPYVANENLVSHIKHGLQNGDTPALSAGVSLNLAKWCVIATAA